MTTVTLPRGFVLRRPTMDDIEGVLQLIHICEIERDGRTEQTLDGLRTEWQAPNVTLAEDAWIVLSPEGQTIGFGRARHRGYVRIFIGGEVHPEYRGRGIGTQLLRLNEEWAQQHIAQAPQGARVAMFTWVGEKNNASRQLAEKHGYKVARSFWRMKIELQATPSMPTWAEGITVKALAEEPTLFRAVFEADNEAFKDHWGHTPSTFEEWEHWTRNRENFDPSLWFLAMDGSEVAAISLCVDEKAWGGWVDTLGVRRKWRRRGLGEALLYHSFGEFYKRGIREVYLGVDAASLTGATRLYERVGMHIDEQSEIYEKEIRAGREISTQSLEQ